MKGNTKVVGPQSTAKRDNVNHPRGYGDNNRTVGLRKDYRVTGKVNPNKA